MRRASSRAGAPGALDGVARLGLRRRFTVSGGYFGTGAEALNISSVYY